MYLKLSSWTVSQSVNLGWAACWIVWLLPQNNARSTARATPCSPSQAEHPAGQVLQPLVIRACRQLQVLMGNTQRPQTSPTQLQQDWRWRLLLLRHAVKLRELIAESIYGRVLFHCVCVCMCIYTYVYICVCVCVCVCVPHLLYLVVCQWTLNCFHILAIVNKFCHL